MHIRKILVPTNFSPHSETAVHEALSLAAQVRGHVVLLHVIPKLVDPWSVALWITREQPKRVPEAEHHIRSVTILCHWRDVVCQPFN